MTITGELDFEVEGDWIPLISNATEIDPADGGYYENISVSLYDVDITDKLSADEYAYFCDILNENPPDGYED